MPLAWLHVNGLLRIDTHLHVSVSPGDYLIRGLHDATLIAAFDKFDLVPVLVDWRTTSEIEVLLQIQGGL